jgi:hypothetical protein
MSYDFAELETYNLMSKDEAKNNEKPLCTLSLTIG